MRQTRFVLRVSGTTDILAYIIILFSVNPGRGPDVYFRFLFIYYDGFFFSDFYLLSYAVRYIIIIDFRSANDFSGLRGGRGPSAAKKIIAHVVRNTVVVMYNKNNSVFFFFLRGGTAGCFCFPDARETIRPGRPGDLCRSFPAAAQRSAAPPTSPRRPSVRRGRSNKKKKTKQKLKKKIKPKNVPKPTRFPVESTGLTSARVRECIRTREKRCFLEEKNLLEKKNRENGGKKKKKKTP